MIDKMEDLPGYHAAGAFVLAKPVVPEQLVLQNYVFLPYARSGIAATISTPFAWGMPARATVTAAIPIDPPTADGDALMTMAVRGPGDVTGVDASQVIRTYPPDGKHDHDPLDLSHIEFDRPDLPWMFTPAAAGPSGLVPWVSLIVADRSRCELAPPAHAGGRPILTVALSELQSPLEAWAWAHAQVLGTKDDPSHSIGDRLSDANPSVNSSRIICPRRLTPSRNYIACLVPTFEPGRLRGLGLPLPLQPVLTPAWSVDGDQDATIDLPVYFSFQFTTSDDGDFESLARRLIAQPAPPAVGRRRLDAGHPGDPITDLAVGAAGAEQIVLGPVVSVNQPDPATAEQDWPSDPWPAASVTELAGRLNDPDTQLHAPAASTPAVPVVAPPIYVSTHVGQSTITPGQPPTWFDELNLDPRNRVVAGLGTRVVQMDQEALMASAWDQVAGLQAANRVLRVAQFARYVATSLHTRHLADLTDGQLVSVTAPVQSRLLDPAAPQPGATVRARMAVSSLPLSATSGAMRRLTRPRGLIGRRVELDTLLTTAGQTRGWVRTFPIPGISTAVSADVVQAVAPFDPATTTAAQVLAGWAEQLTGPTVLDSIPGALTRIAKGPAGQLAGAAAGGAIAGLLARMPDLARLSDDVASTALAASLAVALPAATRVAASVNVGSVLIAGVDARRFKLTDQVDDDGRAKVTLSAVNELAQRITNLARQRNIGDGDLAAAHATAQRLAAVTEQARAVTGPVLADAWKRLTEPVVTPGGVTDIDRSPVAVADLALVASLLPARTVTARIKGRLQVTPSWLRPDWFDDQRVEPIMAGPHFPFPMYSALNRYDPDWMIPGLGQIPGTDTVSLLVSNNLFVETFLLGANDEMEGELLWRSYPTDQRGTPFKSFWTTRDELQQDIPRFSPGELGSHMDPTLGGRLVLLVRGELIRRFPSVIAHAARQVSNTVDETRTVVPTFADPTAQPDYWAPTLFQAPLPPNVLLVGFDITPDMMQPDKDLWWFTLAENPGEPRFGLDADGPAPLPHQRNDLSWADFAMPRGFLSAGAPARPIVDQAAWLRGAGGTAWVLYQLPARAAFWARTMWP